MTISGPFPSNYSGATTYFDTPSENDKSARRTSLSELDDFAPQAYAAMNPGSGQAFGAGHFMPNDGAHLASMRPAALGRSLSQGDESQFLWDGGVPLSDWAVASMNAPAGVFPQQSHSPNGGTQQPNNGSQQTPLTAAATTAAAGGNVAAVVAAAAAAASQNSAANKRIMNPNMNVVFVGGISWRADESTLTRFFGSYGTVTHVKLIMDKQTGRSKGFAFVTFADPDAAERVRAEKLIPFMGKMMNVGSAYRTIDGVQGGVSAMGMPTTGGSSTSVTGSGTAASSAPAPFMSASGPSPVPETSPCVPESTSRVTSPVEEMVKLQPEMASPPPKAPSKSPAQPHGHHRTASQQHQELQALMDSFGIPDPHGLMSVYSPAVGAAVAAQPLRAPKVLDLGDDASSQDLYDRATFFHAAMQKYLQLYIQKQSSAVTQNNAADPIIPATKPSSTMHGRTDSAVSGHSTSVTSSRSSSPIPHTMTGGQQSSSKGPSPQPVLATHPHHQISPNVHSLAAAAVRAGHVSGGHAAQKAPGSLWMPLGGHNQADVFGGFARQQAKTADPTPLTSAPRYYSQNAIGSSASEMEAHQQAPWSRDDLALNANVNRSAGSWMHPVGSFMQALASSDTQNPSMNGMGDDLVSLVTNFPSVSVTHEREPHPAAASQDVPSASANDVRSHHARTLSEGHSDVYAQFSRQMQGDM